MNSRTFIYLGIFALLAGAVLCFTFRSITTEGVTLVAGIIFLGVGVFNILFPVGGGKDSSPQGARRFLSLMADVAAIVLGASMLVFSATFARIIAFVFGLVIAFAALWQFVFIISYGRSDWRLPSWLYLFPVGITAGAVYIFMQNGHAGADSRIMMATGISLVLLGLACLIENIVLGVKRNRNQQPAGEVRPAEPAAADTETVKPEEAGVATLQKRTRPETSDDLDDEIID